MKYTGLVTPEDLDRIAAILAASINGRPVDTKREATDLVYELDRLDSRGEHWARRALTALTIDGAHKLVAAYTKVDRACVTISRTGEVMSIPARFGSRKRRDDGTAEKGFQQRFWWDYPWDEFEQLIATLASQRDILNSRVDSLGEALYLREEFPDTVTPGEACERKGIDPRQFQAM